MSYYGGQNQNYGGNYSGNPYSGNSNGNYNGGNAFGIKKSQIGGSLRPVDFTNVKLMPFQKNFYAEHPEVAKMSEQEAAQWRTKHECTVLGENVPKPIGTFEQGCFPDYILTEIMKAGFASPTTVQAQGWPMALSGRDVIGISKTGSGKTLAFLLPAIVHINAQALLRPGDGPIALVIAPTRELACQIKEECTKFSASSQIKITCVYGGAPKRDQARDLRRGVEILIATPGRLLDFLERGQTNLRRVTYMVIDEADRLLDMGFEPQLKAILSQVRPDRQMIMYSATWPKEVRELASEFIKDNPLQVNVGSSDVHANSDVTQIIKMVEKPSKEQALFGLLQEYVTTNETKVLIFSATKRECDNLCRQLRYSGYQAQAIHGDKEQRERERVLRDFKSGKSPIMIATDVASRGLHVNDIALVINYDFPNNIEDYVHRIGRTGRAGNKGVAISFFTRQDSKLAKKLVNILKEAKQTISPELFQVAQNSRGNFGGRQRYRSKGNFGGFRGRRW